MEERLSPAQYDTLDGVLEPAENPKLFGHHDARDLISAAVRSGKLHHGLLLTGPRGVGKATLAFHLANWLNNQNVTALDVLDPSAPVFRQIAMGAHPGVLHLTRPANDRGNGFKTALTVEEIRRIGRFLSMTAHDGGWRVVIIDAADDMNRNAANALLKNLEEPPARTVFILIAHSIGGLLPTIRSRCQLIRLQPLDKDDLLASLAGIDDMAAIVAENGEALAQRAAGSVRQAIVLTQHGGLEIASALDKLASAPSLDIAAAHQLAEAERGRDKSVTLEIFNARSLELLADSAARSAESHDLDRANLLANAWQDARIAITDTNTYNLDQKQHALTMIRRLNLALGRQDVRT